VLQFQANEPISTTFYPKSVSSAVGAEPVGGGLQRGDVVDSQEGIVVFAEADREHGGNIRVRRGSKYASER